MSNRANRPVTANHENFAFVMQCLEAGVNPMLVGPAGSGKTTIAHNIAKEKGLPFHFTGAVESSFQLKGFVDAHGRVVETSFVKAYRDGGIFLFDEIDASDPSALVAVHAALDNGIFDSPGGIIHRHTNFQFIAGANTWGHGATLDYMGRNHLDGATLDRFVPVAMDYDEVFELALMKQKYPDQVGSLWQPQPVMGLDQEVSQRLAQLKDKSWTDIVFAARAAARDLSLRHIISTRAHLKGAALLKVSADHGRVIDSVLLWGLETDTKVKLLEAMNKRLVVVPKPAPTPKPASKSAASQAKPAPKPAPAQSVPPAAASIPAPAEAFTDPRIGHYIRGKGIFMGLWEPKDRDGTSLGKKFNVYAAPTDIRDDHGDLLLLTHNNAVKCVAGLRNWHGHDGGDFKSDTVVYAALKNGTGIGKWFLPTRDLLQGVDVDGNVVRVENIYALRNTGAFKGTLNTTQSGSARAHWYLSCTEDRDNPDGVYTVDFTDGDAVWYVKGGLRLSCRLCRVELVSEPAKPVRSDTRVDRSDESYVVG